MEVEKGVLHVEAGTTAPQTGTYRCLRCGIEQMVQKHDRIPACRYGHTVFELRMPPQESSPA